RSASIPPPIAAGEPSAGSAASVWTNASAAVVSPTTTWSRIGAEPGGARLPARSRCAIGMAAASAIATVAIHPLQRAIEPLPLPTGRLGRARPPGHAHLFEDLLGREEEDLSAELARLLARGVGIARPE